MHSYDERTQRGWPLPFKSNTLEFDVERLRETFCTIDKELADIQQNTEKFLNETMAGIEEKQYILDTRMDVIAGQATNDTEILDARVDAKGVTHPNVGHNVRTLHGELIELNEALKYGISEFHGLLRQFNELAEAQIQGDLNSQKAHNRRKAELAAETQARIESDDALREGLDQEIRTREELDSLLQEQTQELSEASLQHSLNLRHEAKSRREGFREANEALNAETTAREEHDEALRQGIESVNEELSLEKSERFKSDQELQQKIDKEEANARIVQGEVLQSEIDNLTDTSLRQNLNVHYEAKQRRTVNEALKSETNSRIEADDELRESIADRTKEITSEAQLRSSEDLALQTQIDDLSREAMQDKINALATDERRKQEAYQEVSTNAEQNEVQQEQIDTLAQSSLWHSLNLHSESEKRREGFSDTQRQLDAQRERIEEQEEQSIQHQTEIENLINAILRSSLNFHEALEHRREALNHEAEIRSEQVHSLQTQTQELSETGIQQSLNIHKGAEQRRLLSSKTMSFIDTQLALNDCLQK